MSIFEWTRDIADDHLAAQKLNVTSSNMKYDNIQMLINLINNCLLFVHKCCL